MKQTDEVFPLGEIRKNIADFATARDWNGFHTPKNLSMALSVESSELMEIFQWLTEEQSRSIMEDPTNAKNVRDEVADILVYLIRLTDILGIQLEHAVKEKMIDNDAKYPIETSKGLATKYHQLPDVKESPND